jgi:hypothetical protein
MTTRGLTPGHPSTDHELAAAGLQGNWAPFSGAHLADGCRRHGLPVKLRHLGLPVFPQLRNQNLPQSGRVEA